MEFKRETRVVLTVILALVVLESTTRVFETRLSADVRQMREHALLSGRIEKARAQGRATVLVLGNSLAAAGLRAGKIQARFAELGLGEPEILYLTADASNVSDWVAAYRNHLAKVEPDYLLIGTGEHHLEDRKVVSPEKLGAYHAAGRDFPMIVGDWLPTNGERCRFLLAKVSSFFANRERIRPLLFYGFVPGFEAVSRRLNEAGRPEKASSGSFERLGFLLDSVKIPAERVMLVEIPLPWKYELAPGARDRARARGVRIFDGDAAGEWKAVDFPDAYHLAPASGDRFTVAVMRAFLPGSESPEPPR